MAFDRNYKDSRILVTGGAGFLGSHLCERLLARGPRRAVRRQFLHRHASDNIAHLLDQPAFRADAPRRDLPALRRGRRDLQPRLPGLADPLPARPGADDQDQRARRDQHAGPRQAGEGARSSRPRPARSTATRRPSADRETTGATSTRSARASCYDEGKRCAETLFFDYHRQHRLRIKVARIFNTYGPRMHPERRARGVELHRPGAARASRSPSTATAARRAPSATSTT